METNFTYELIQTQVDGEVIKRIDADGNEAWIPTDEGNSDYQAYLLSLEPVETPKSK